MFNTNVNFKYSVDDIIWKVRTAYATGMYQLYADCLYIENNRGGDIETGNQTPDRIEEIRLELTKQIFVRNVPPTLIISGQDEIVSDNLYNLELLNRSDPGLDTITHWTIDWGDDCIETVEGNPSTWTHRYDKIGVRRITATATDEDGTWNANTVNVQVQVFVPQTEWIRLVEDDRFVTEYRTNFTVQNGQAMVLDIRNLQFDGQSEGMINDAFEVALVDQNG
ncbi:MAG: PKD domain-containing protein, partial [Planctomycetaceae bacterium]|nr:PKD domain-containing protein [Planctomycetaceae bacterium]